MESSSLVVDGGELTLGSGLLAVLRPGLLLLEPSGTLKVLSRNISNRADLPRWCQWERHEYVGLEETPEGDVHTIKRGLYPKIERETSDWPEQASPKTGFGPRGSMIEEGGPNYPFSVCEDLFAGPEEIKDLYDQATQSQWCAQTDIKWEKLPALPDSLERAVAEVMTFLAENELSALYLPSRFVSQIHPYFVESCQFLATQMMDESRHIEVFLRRAKHTASLGTSSVVTSESLLSLLRARDFLEASFLLSVLGEGTFLDLLTFIEQNAPDEVTENIVHRARQDESRHVNFGITHVRHALLKRPSLKAHLRQSVERRANSISNISGAPATLQDSLIVLAARGTDPKSIRKAHNSYRELLETMEKNRTKRLKSVGFSAEEADYLSHLHTPNFM